VTVSKRESSISSSTDLLQILFHQRGEMHLSSCPTPYEHAGRPSWSMQHTTEVRFHNVDEESPTITFRTNRNKIKYSLTLVVSLYPRLPKYASSVSHQAVLFGGDRRKSSFVNCNIFRSTASDGSKGAQGNKDRDRSCNAAVEHWHTWSSICSIPL
jgi:hypothetical protein